MKWPFPEDAQRLASGQGLGATMNKGLPPLRRWPARWQVATAPAGSAIRQVVEELTGLGLLAQIHPARATPGFFARPFTVPKPGGKARMVLDATALNEWITTSHFRLPTLQTIAPLLAGAESVGTTDAMHAFHRVAASPEMRQLTRFAIRLSPKAPVEVYEHKGLCMGASSSPWLLVKTMANVVAVAHATTAATSSHHVYMDDVITISSLPPGATAEKALTTLRATMTAAGVAPNPAKCTPMAREARVLGFDVSLESRRVAAPTTKIHATLQAVQALLETPARRVPVKQRARLLGLIQALAPGLRLTQSDVTYLRSELATLTAADPKLPVWRSMYARMWRGSAALTDLERGDLQRWASRLQGLLASPDARWATANAQPMRRPSAGPTTIVLATDASDTGYGAHLVIEHPSLPQSVWAAAVTSWPGVRSRLRRPATALQVANAFALAGRWTPEEAQQHSTWRELEAAARALRRLEHFFDLTDATIMLLSDSSATVATINKGGARAASLLSAWRPIQALQMATGAHVLAAHLPGIANTRADELSRRFDPAPAPQAAAPQQRSPLANAVLTDLGIQVAAAPLARPFGLDLFADPQSSKAPRHVAWRYSSEHENEPPERRPIAYNALVHDWLRLAGSEPVLVFPPPRLLPLVVMRLLESPTLKGALIAPTSPNAAWWRAMATRAPPKLLPKGSVTAADGSELAWNLSWSSFHF